MQKLAFMAGRWVNDAGLSQEASWIVGGKYLRIERQARGAAGTRSLVLAGYDSDARQYRLWSFGQNGWPLEWVGHFEGDRLVFTNERILRAIEEHPSAVTGLFSTDARPTAEGYWRINQVIPNSAADQAGVQVGDIVTRIDGHSVQGLTSQQETDLELGKIGTTAQVTLRRGGQERAVTIVRQPLRVPRRIIEEPRSSNEYWEWGETLVGDHYEKSPEVRVWKKQ